MAGGVSFVRYKRRFTLRAMNKYPALSAWLARASPWAFALYASLVSAGAYTCIFALRKPFTAATFAGLQYAGIDYKIWLITAQVVGYMLSKWIGVKVISEMSGERRAAGILLMALVAGLALLGFGLVPPPYNIGFLFLNGLPLGMGWGFMLGYLEGRRLTEVLTAGLSAGFIFSSGLSKSLGLWVMQAWGVSEYWMPLVVAGLVALPLAGLVYLLDHLPPPTAQDEALRTRRAPMRAAQRWQFVRTFLPGLALLILAYVLLTAYRDFRDNFAAELWIELGLGGQAQLFAQTETPIALGVLLVISLMMLVRDNQRATVINFWIVMVGFALVGAGTWAFERGLLPPVWWIGLVGLGLYLGYVQFNSILFDRLIATFRYVSNVGFLIYLADSVGYLGSIGVLFYKNFGQGRTSWLDFFVGASYVVSLLGVGLMLAALGYFWVKKRGWEVVRREANNGG
jgi:hypothetical protein